MKKDIHALGGGGPSPEHMTPAGGAKLVAQGYQEARHANRTGTTYAEGKHLKEMNVEDLKSYGAQRTRKILKGGK